MGIIVIISWEKKKNIVRAFHTFCESICVMADVTLLYLHALLHVWKKVVSSHMVDTYTDSGGFYELNCLVSVCACQTFCARVASAGLNKITGIQMKSG